MNSKKPVKKQNTRSHGGDDIQENKTCIWDLVTYLLFGLLAFAGSFFLVLKNKTFKKPLKPGEKIDIEIRYECEKDADATLLAQNLVKIIRMVLMPLESQVKKEDAKLIFVYGGDFWEMRLKNSSEHLKNSVKRILEAREW